MDQEKSSGNFWVGFLLGGFIGATIIVLMGTKEGKKVAEKLLEKGELLEEDLEEKIAKLQEKGEELLAEAEEVKEKAMEKIDEKKETLGELMVEKMDQALTNIENLQKKGVEVTQQVHHQYFKKDGRPLSS